MWVRSDHRGVRIFVRGEFAAPRQWLIRAIATGGSRTDTAIGAASRQRILSEVWQGILYESRVGRHLGAIAIRVVVEGDRDIASVFTTAGDPEGSLAPAPCRVPSDETPGFSIAPIAEGDSAHSTERTGQVGASAN